MPDDPASSEIERKQARQQAEHHYYAALDLVLEGHHEQAVEEYRQAVAADLAAQAEPEEKLAYQARLAAPDPVPFYPPAT